MNAILTYQYTKLYFWGRGRGRGRGKGEAAQMVGLTVGANSCDLPSRLLSNTFRDCNGLVRILNFIN